MFGTTRLVPRVRPGISLGRLMSSSREAPKQTCLHDFHVQRQAKMEPFAGYLMPIVYKGQTITSEHMQTRKSASIFDVSHMLQTIVKGNDRIPFLECITVTDIEGLALNKCALSVFTNDLGGIIDDCIIGKCLEHLQIVSNAANADTVWRLLCETRDKNPQFQVDLDRLDNQGLIALQGPQARNVLQSMTKIELERISFMQTTMADINSVGECSITRCGYTGEDGFEISVAPDRARTLMESLADHDLVTPAGLGARDTLRLEAGLCLHGHDISETTTPVEASLSWVIQKRRRSSLGFPGATNILEQLKSGTKLKRVGLIAKLGGGPPAREGSEVLGRAGAKLGQVTSGNYAPSLGRNIAMAYLSADVEKQQGKSVSCTVRGKEYEYQITKMPFVKTNYFISK